MSLFSSADLGPNGLGQEIQKCGHSPLLTRSTSQRKLWQGGLGFEETDYLVSDCSRLPLWSARALVCCAITLHMPKPLNLVAILATLAAGVLIPFQSRMNAGLGEAMADGIGAALYSFTSGWIVISIVLLFSTRARVGLKRIIAMLLSGELPVWLVIGGAFGGFMVMTQGLAAGALGISLFTVAVVAGQGLSALVIDARGWFRVEKRSLSLARALGAVTVIIGVGLVAENPSLDTAALLALPFLGGLGLGYQQAVNGVVRITAESAIAATFINFAMGSLFLVVVKLVSLPSTGISQSYPTQWWLYMGGIAGLVYVGIQVITVAKIGVLGLGVLLGTGQLIGALIIDLFFPIVGEPLTALHFIGVFVTLGGAVLVNLRR